MEFRWVAAIALWTILSGPIFVQVRTVGQPRTVPVKSRVSIPLPKHGHLDAFARPR